MINYTFIIPHKNSPDLLRKCIDSIPHRDDVQIIIVDDNSESSIVDFDNFPGVGEKCTEVYFTKESKGAGYARNVGLSHADGKWIVFADADDFFNPCINEAMDLYMTSKVELVLFKGNSIKIPSGLPSYRGDLFNELLEKALLTNDYSEVLMLSVPWRRFIKYDFISEYNIKFNEVRWSNDVIFMGYVAKYVSKVEASRLEIYCTTESDNSLIKNTSLECAICRFIEDSKNVKLLKCRYNHVDMLFYYHFITWFNVYKKSKIKGIYYLPYAIWSAGHKFLKEIYKAKFL